jgi:hypothetical protein
MWAVGRASMESDRAIASQAILAGRHGLKMGWVHTRPDAAEVVEL